MAEPKILKALWGSPDRPLKIGDLEIPAYVLENGTRVLSGRGMQTALQLGQSHGSKLKGLLRSKNIKPHITNELAMALDAPLRFVRPGTPLTQAKDRVLVQELTKDAAWDKLLLQDDTFRKWLAYARG